jgi:Ca-activated chloride channel homolog
MRYLAAFIILIASVVLTFAQQVQPTPMQTPAPAQPRTVNVSLMIVDHSNHSRDDIQKDEIRLLENNLPQTIQSFSKVDKAVDYGVAIDNSGSLRSQLPIVVRAVQLLIEDQGPNDQCFIERFISSDKIETVQEFTSDKSRLLKAVDSLYIEIGQSAVVDGIYVAVQHVARQPLSSQRRRALVLVTDGEDRASYYTEEQLINLLRATDVQLFVIGLLGELDNEAGFIRQSPRDRARQFLKKIARESGGRVSFPTKKTELSEALAEIFHDLHSQYEISYQSSDPSTDNFHPLRIEVVESPSRQKVTVVTRPGYYLTPPEIDAKDKKKKPKKP